MKLVFNHLISASLTHPLRSWQSVPSARINTKTMHSKAESQQRKQMCLANTSFPVKRPFGGRPEHGLQERRLGETLLFVLPSTSPANAAVPWDERLSWFRALRQLVP